MPGQERIERMLRDVWQGCRVRFEQALRPFEIALGERLNELFKDSTSWPERWSAFVSEWQARGVLVSEPSQRAIEELLDLVARQQLIPRDPSGRYFAPTAAPPAPPPPGNATSPNWPALTEPQRERIRRESEIPWWYPVQPRVPGDASYEKVLEAKGRAARDRLLAFFQSLEALGARADADDGNTDDGIDAIEGHIRHVHDAYDTYIAAYITLQQHALHYLETRPFLGMFIAGLLNKLDLALPPSLFGMHSKYERELIAVQAELTKASNSLSRRVDVTYTVAVWTDRVITAIEMATFATAVVTVARTAAVKAVAEGATRAAALNLAIKAGIKQAAIQVLRQMAITTVLPEVLIAAGLDEQQVRKGLLLLDAVPTLMNLRTIKVERARSALSTKASVPATAPTDTPNLPGRLDDPSNSAAPPSVPTAPRDHRTTDGPADSTPDLPRGKTDEPVIRPATEGPAKQLQANKQAGDAARDRIAQREAPATIEESFLTVGGIRRVDVKKEGDKIIAIESKVGRTVLGKRVRQELARDWWLLRQGKVDVVIWEFTRSEATNLIGPTPALLDKLVRLGIEVRIQP